jgi:multicomponent Na+:H+ antiporter subunit C
MFETLDIFAVGLFFIGFLGLIISRNIVKSIIFTLVMQTSVIMFWLFLSGRSGQVPPIIGSEEVNNASYLPNIAEMADPLPQALMLTTIIIGICVVAVNIVMLNTLFRKYETSDWEIMTKRSREDDVEFLKDNKSNYKKNRKQG